MKMKQIIALSIAAIACAACSTPEAVDNAGLLDWQVEFTEDGKPKSIRIRDGKEKAGVKFKVDLQAGKAEYSATDVKAFDGQGYAAKVAEVQANEQGQTVREVLRPEALSEIVELARTFADG